MLALFAALALSLPAELPKYTVEFRVLRVPAGLNKALIESEFKNDRLFKKWRGTEHRQFQFRPTSTSSDPVNASDDELLDAGGLPGQDAVTRTWWDQKAGMSGPTLRVDYAQIAECVERPLWNVVTFNDESRNPYDWRSTARFESREVLVGSTTFTAAGVSVEDGRVELTIKYSESPLPTVKLPTPAMSPHLVPFYGPDAPALEPPVPAFLTSRERSGLSASEQGVIRPGGTLVMYAGRTAKPMNNDLLGRRSHLERLYSQQYEEDVIVFATVRE